MPRGGIRQAPPLPAFRGLAFAGPTTPPLKRCKPFRNPAGDLRGAPIPRCLFELGESIAERASEKRPVQLGTECLTHCAQGPPRSSPPQHQCSHARFGTIRPIELTADKTLGAAELRPARKQGRL